MIETIISRLSGTKFSFVRIEPTGTAGKWWIDVVTEAQPIPVPLQLASQGTLSVVAIVGLIFEYLKVVAPTSNVKEPQNAPGLVIIDEVDAHLHPVWQSSVVDLLRESFPNVQFICAAHSPLVVAGSLENEVSVLRRGRDDKFQMHNIYSDFVGWKAEDILRTIFDIEDQDPMFNRYAAMAPRRNELTLEAQTLERKQPLSEAESARLQHLLRDIHYIDKTHEMQQRRSEAEYLLVRAQQHEGKLRDSNQHSRDP
jgi:predicted ATP-binding protein involved in virulence